MKYLIIALALLAFNAEASYIDLSGGDIVAKAECHHKDKDVFCLIVLHKDLVFVVVLDEKGEYEIYLVEEEVVLIWARDSI